MFAAAVMLDFRPHCGARRGKRPALINPQGGCAVWLSARRENRRVIARVGTCLRGQCRYFALCAVQDHSRQVAGGLRQPLLGASSALPPVGEKGFILPRPSRSHSNAYFLGNCFPPENRMLKPFFFPPVEPGLLRAGRHKKAIDPHGIDSLLLCKIQTISRSSDRTSSGVLQNARISPSQPLPPYQRASPRAPGTGA